MKSLEISEQHAEKLKIYVEKIMESFLNKKIENAILRDQSVNVPTFIKTIEDFLNDVTKVALKDCNELYLFKFNESIDNIFMKPSLGKKFSKLKLFVDQKSFYYRHILSTFTIILFLLLIIYLITLNGVFYLPEHFLNINRVSSFPSITLCTNIN